MIIGKIPKMPQQQFFYWVAKDSAESKKLGKSQATSLEELESRLNAQLTTFWDGDVDKVNKWLSEKDSYHQKMWPLDEVP